MPMNGNGRKLLTIVTETALEQLLVKEVEALGANGYTITDARGKGSHGFRSSDWEQSSNIRMEVVCSEDTANQIAERVHEKYAKNYAMILFLADVSVLRPQKF